MQLEVDNAVSARLRRFRKHKNLTQAEAADLVGISHQAWGNYERSKAKPSMFVLQSIVANLGLNPTWLLTGEGEMEVGAEQETEETPPGEEEAIIDQFERNGGIKLTKVTFKVGAGGGGLVAEKEVEGSYIIDSAEVQGARGQLPDGLFVAEVMGDSMEDEFRSGDQVIFAPVSPSMKRLKADAVYIFRLEGMINIKRLQALPKRRILVISENEQYRDFEIELDAGVDFEILGKAWGRFKRY